MVRAWDRYDDRLQNGDGDAPRAGRTEGFSPRPLEVVRQPELGFELVAPADFAAAQTIADRLREGVPVLVDLGACSPELRGRMTDFASGLVYALDGRLQHVGDDVLLLAPGRLGVSGDEVSAVRRPGFFNRS